MSQLKVGSGSISRPHRGARVCSCGPAPPGAEHKRECRRENCGREPQICFLWRAFEMLPRVGGAPYASCRFSGLSAQAAETGGPTARSRRLSHQSSLRSCCMLESRSARKAGSGEQRAEISGNCSLPVPPRSLPWNRATSGMAENCGSWSGTTDIGNHIAGTEAVAASHPFLDSN